MRVTESLKKVLGVITPRREKPIVTSHLNKKSCDYDFYEELDAEAKKKEEPK